MKSRTVPFLDELHLVMFPLCFCSPLWVHLRTIQKPSLTIPFIVSCPCVLHFRMILCSIVAILQFKCRALRKPCRLNCQVC